MDDRPVDCPYPVCVHPFYIPKILNNFTDKLTAVLFRETRPKLTTDQIKKFQTSRFSKTGFIVRRGCQLRRDHGAGAVRAPRGGGGRTPGEMAALHLGIIEFSNR